MSIEVKDLAIVAATVLGPILAVQAQKAIERIRERKSRKSRDYSIFTGFWYGSRGAFVV